VKCQHGPRLGREPVPVAVTRVFRLGCRMSGLPSAQQGIAMKCTSHVVLAAWLLCGLLLSAQTTPVTSEQIIPSDTMGVDFGPYLQRVRHDVRMNWHNVIPTAAYRPLLKQGKVLIKFTILKDGSVADMKLTEPSGDVSFDRAAWGGIIASSPFPPLPNEFNGQHIRLRFYFYYNPITVAISPEDHVQVIAGSLQEFAAKVKGTTDAAVTWNVKGKGCWGSSCGTIEGNLQATYIAPTILPNPAFVTVTATPVADGVTVPASVKVHLVAANGIAISPTSAQVVSGTAQQFSVAVITTEGTVMDWKAITTPMPTNWAVFGTGCEGAACGTVSAAGLYTAPATVPSPPNVTVRATLSTDPSKTASATVVIVKPEPSQ